MILKRLIQLIRATKLTFDKKIKLQSIWNTRMSSHCRVGGDGTIVFLGRAELLNNVAIMAATPTSKVEIGDNVFVNRNVIIACRKHICIGKDTVIGPNVLIYDHDHRFDANGRVKESAHNPYKEDDVIIGENVWIGAGVIILRGTVIGDGAIIAAGAFVKGNVPSRVLVKREIKNIIENL